MNNYYSTNQKYWDESVDIHTRSEFYELEQFLNGKNKLHFLEREELGDVQGKKILHLQCHFGMDSLSLEMLGANVTGVDFSPRAIEKANELKDKLNLNSHFILSDVYSLPEKLDEKFDIVYTSYGVLTWLQDLNKWAKVISHFLKPGGMFYIAEVHPVSMLFEEERSELKIRFPYFHNKEPLRLEDYGDYANRNAKMQNTVTFEWQHSIADIFNALMKNDLKITYFKEHNFTVWQQFSSMIKDERRVYVFPKNSGYDLPLLFSLKTVK